MIDGEPLVWFSFEDGHYLLNVTLFDRTNHLILLIKQNELVYSSSPWDIEFVGRRLIIRAAARDIFIDLTFEPPNTVRFTRGHFLFNGVEFLIRPNYAMIVNNRTFFRGNQGTDFGRFQFGCQCAPVISLERSLLIRCRDTTWTVAPQ